MKKLFQELKRRSVVKETIAYLVVAWLLLQVFDVVLPIWNAPNWILQVITITLALGLPLWIAFSWHYQFTSSGIKRTKNLEIDSNSTKVNRILNATIIISLIAVISLIWINPSLVTAKSTNKPSIAVLPFTNLSDDQSNDWFSVGVTEDILTHLSKIKGLRVISRTSVMQYRNSQKSLPEIAKELNVNYVVEGSVRKQNNQVLITAQLLNIDDEHLWADNYNEELTDAFKIQQDVAQKIVSQLKVYVSPEEEDALKMTTTTNALAMELFAKGRNLADSRTPTALKQSLELYKEAVKIDSLFAEGYAEIANSYMLLYIYGDLSKKESAENANDYIDKALKINPNISRPYTVRAMLIVRDGDWNRAGSYFEKAIEINPNDATARHHYAIHLRDNPEPNPKEELVQITEANRLDPLSKPITKTLVDALIVNHRIEEARSHFEKHRFFYLPEEIVFMEGLLNSVFKKDLSELIYSYEGALMNDPENAHYLQALSDCYMGIMVDREKSLQYAKRVSDVDPSNSIFIREKLTHLLFNKQFEEASKIVNDSSVMGQFGSFQKIVMLCDFYYFQKKYNMAAPILEQLKEINLRGYYSNKAWYAALRGDAKTTYQLFNSADFDPDDFEKTSIFMNLKERDSVFHYLNKLSKIAKMDLRIYRLMQINGSYEADPYRMDPRYQEIMERNYFPLKAIPKKN